MPAYYGMKCAVDKSNSFRTNFKVTLRSEILNIRSMSEVEKMWMKNGVFWGVSLRGS
jgi:hypothetical protein